ncbi:MAG: hypothetical protein KDC11_03465 [Chitinophagaceae bacterium]|nr:hypothetical protein [Chitinophagaceae bacterium]
MKEHIKILIIGIFVVIASCNKREPEPTPTQTVCDPTYNAQIKPIIDNKCALSGCHDVNTTVADFTKYSELKSRADDSKLRQYVLEQRIMPPTTTTQLTQEEEDLFKCWLDNGAKEN